MFVLLKEDAVKLFGSQIKLAAALGITPQAITHWKKGEGIPQAHAYRIRYDLKPEEFNSKRTKTAA